MTRDCHPALSAIACRHIPMMNSLIHALNIGTLAAWLSLLGFGTVGVFLPGGQAPRTMMPLEKLETLTVTADLTLDDDHLSDSSPPAVAASPPATRNNLPAPPALPDLASVSPLPEVPDLPSAPEASQATRAAPQATASRTPRAAAPGKPAAAMAGNARIAAGHMPAPDYPPFARRNHQEGTVVVEFCVNSSGRVTAAFAKNPSPWPLLNDAAVRTVRKWSFPPGADITLDRPIVFRLK